jgi:hypothetical protein
MAQADFEERIFKELDIIKKQLIEIRENMIDVDCVLTDEERDLVDKSYEHKKEGKLIPISEVKKELGL